MFNLKCFQAAAMSLAALGFGFAGTDASAGSCGSQRSYSHGHHSGGHVSASYRGDGYRVSVSVGSGRHYDRGHATYRSSRHYDRGHSRSYNRSYSRCDTPVVHHVQHQPSGYWSRVYRPPVYETRYRSCGTPYRVCIRAGYYERVWVTTGHHRY